MMIAHILLLCMFLSYSFIIYTVQSLYSNNYSISSIVCGNECNQTVTLSMAIMGLFTVVYESLRGDTIPFLLITTLLIGIMGVLHTNEKQIKHLVYSLIAFGSIVSFMIYMTQVYYNHVLVILVALQIIFAILMGVFIKYNIFYLEVLSLVNFALFYMYVHYLQFILQHNQPHVANYQTFW